METIENFDKILQHVKDVCQTKEVTPSILTASAILTLAVEMNNVAGNLRDFDHQICMGIRYGLYGTGTNSGHSLGDELPPNNS